MAVERSRHYPFTRGAEDLDNVHRLRAATQEPASTLRRNGRDWTSALQAIYQASEHVSATETRARDIEARGIALAERAIGELKEAESRIRAIEEALRQAEARATEAEARATEAEEWLARLNDAIHDGLLTRRALSPRRANAA